MMKYGIITQKQFLHSSVTQDSKLFVFFLGGDCPFITGIRNRIVSIWDDLGSYNIYLSTHVPYDISILYAKLQNLT